VRRSSSTIRSDLEGQRREADKRVAAHWAEVQEKQREAARLRGDIRRLEGEESEARQRHADALERRNKYSRKHESDDWRSCDREATLAANEAHHLSCRVQGLRQDLQVTLKPPAPVIQPLPSEDDGALQVLFFARVRSVAPLLASAMRMAFVAQQAVYVPASTLKGALRVSCGRAHSLRHVAALNLYLVVKLVCTLACILITPAHTPASLLQDGDGDTCKTSLMQVGCGCMYVHTASNLKPAT
jgi:hypothetical protein